MNRDDRFQVCPSFSEGSGNLFRELAEAEFRLGQDSAESSHCVEPHSPHAVQELQAELRIQQIQLRMQREEIDRLKLKVNASHNRWDDRTIGDVVDSLGGIFWTADFGSSRVKYVSKQAEQMLGYPVSDWLSQDNFWQNHIHPLDRDAVTSQCCEEASRGIGHRILYRMVAADGRTVWIDDMVGVSLKDGKPSEVYGLMVDVTDCVEIKARLGVENELLELIASGAPLRESLSALALAIEKHQGDIRCSILLADNDAGVLRHGAAPSLPEEYVRAVDGVAIADSVGSCCTAAFRRQLIVVEDIAEDPLWADYKDFALRHSLRACWSSPIMDSRGKLFGTFGIYKDEPGRPTAEHLRLIQLATHIAVIAICKDGTETSLRTSERELRLVLDNIPGLVARVDRDLRYRYVNDQYERAFGLSRESVVGRKIRDVIGQELFDQGEEFYRQALDGQKVCYESSHTTEQGTTVAWYENLVPELDGHGEVIGFFVMASDISEAKQSQAEREEALCRLQKIAREVPGVVYQYRQRVDGTSCFPYASDRVREIFGIAPEDLIDDASKIFALHHPDDRELVVASIIESAKNLSPWSQEYRLRFEDGTERWVFGNSIPEREPNGSTLWHGYLVDITERKNAEASLALNAKLLELTGAVAKIGGWEIDLVSNQLRWTSETYRIHELDANTEVSVDQAISFYEPSARSVIRARVEAGIKDGKPWSAELPLTTAKGRQIWVHAQGLPFVENGKVVKLIGAFQDITDRKNFEASQVALETQLRESQKLEAVGTLASGIAHDFNNILAIILGNAEIGQNAFLKGDDIEIQSSFLEIKKAGERARDLVRQIISFSRSQPTQLRPTSLGPVVDESARLLRSIFPSSVIIETQLAADVPGVDADKSLVQQVIVNLATNSMQAMQDQRGCIRIGLDCVGIHDDSIRHRPDVIAILSKLPGSVVRLIVSDNGCGMDAAVIQRIFEPFFTTKKVGQGTGLGLSVVHGIVRSHSGEISVESEPGTGTKITVFLPISRSISDSTNQSSHDDARKKPTCKTSEARVLLIDDDASVLRSMKLMLEAFGCRVSDYSDPFEAMDAFRFDPLRFDWALVDYTMAEMCGIEVARHIRQIRNNLPIAIASGFIDDELVLLAGNVGITELLPKPCSSNTLKSILSRSANV